MEERINRAFNYISENIECEPDTGLILGSGLGVLADEIEETQVISYENIPGFPVSTVDGHAGRLVCGNLAGEYVMTLQGRFHYYEGYEMDEIVLPVRIMKLMGIDRLIITNAAGGINLNFSPGDLMFITDHINMMGDNPLRGDNQPDFGPRFPDMSEIYSKKLIEIGEKCASDLGIITRRGVYVGVMGPSYETPAEIRYFRAAGADVVGMSTVPEAIVASHMGISVLGISCITNMAAGVLPEPLSHEEVIETAEKVKPKFISLVKNILEVV